MKKTFCFKYKYDKEYSKKRKKYFEKYYKENAQVYVDYNERRRERHSLEPRIRMKDGARRRALKKGLEYNLKSYKDLPDKELKNIIEIINYCKENPF